MLAAPLVFICKAGLDAFPLPGLGPGIAWADPLKWGFAVGLCAADSVLFVAWLKSRNHALIAGVAAVVALSVGLEALNIKAGLRSNAGAAAVAGSSKDRAQDELSSARAAVADAERELSRWVQTKAVWTNDGDPGNDGAQDAARLVLEDRRKAEAELRAAFELSAAMAERAAVEVHPLAEGGGWGQVLAGLAIVKVLALFLSYVVHGGGFRGDEPTGPQCPNPAGKPPRKPRKAKLGNGGAVASIAKMFGR